MKKFISIILIICSVFSLYASITIPVKTSRGEKAFIVPDEMTCEEALAKLAEAYYEQTWDYENLLKEAEVLKNKSENFVFESKKLRDDYNNILNKYQKLSSDYSELLQKINKKDHLDWFRPTLGAKVELDTMLKIQGAGLSVGFLAFDKILITSEFSYPWKFGLGLAVTF